MRMVLFLSATLWRILVTLVVVTVSGTMHLKKGARNVGRVFFTRRLSSLSTYQYIKRKLCGVLKHSQSCTASVALTCTKGI